ncbi:MULTISPECIES: type VII secretion-associated serine protease mycosin [unclassified Streptomyces]|uniref:type VII secretion-associated serine protease mycosin n=2 Tax=unclassified Streptomyces TaxID=2593676 RepID=UPI001EF13A9B|nr:MULTISPECIES: type VII secretion-associated serine protease mycosin [unclassified Streptomyces]
MASMASFPAARRAAAALAATAALAGLTATPAVADGTDPQLASTDCQFGGKVIKGTPWSLQRVITKQLWEGTSLRGDGITVAVIDTGVDKNNPQLAGKVLPGKSFAGKGSKATADSVGHGTKVAGIIAAKDGFTGTGFHGMAPDARILPLQTSTAEEGGNLATMVAAIKAAVDAGVDVINISQGTTADKAQLPTLQAAVDMAERAKILIVASAGNDGASGKPTNTYPAALDNANVLSVAASDRNNERAVFSTPNEHVDIAAPGVDMVSTVPISGQCVDQGTSFSAPYAAGVAALIKQKHPKWTPAQIIWHLEATATRSHPAHDKNVGWGVIDPVTAIKDETEPTGPVTDADLQAAEATNRGDDEKIIPAKLTLGETPAERNARYGTYLVIGGGLLLGVISAGAMARRDWLRKRGADVL